MLIFESAQPAPIGRIRLPASRASRISPSSDSPAYRNISNPVSRAPSGPTLSTSKISATVVRCVTWTPFHDCAPRSSRWTIVRASVQRPGLRRRAAAAPADSRRRHDAESQEGEEHLRQAPPDPDLLEAEPRAICEAAVGDGQVLAPQAPGEALECLRLPLRAWHVLRLRITD